MRRRRKNPSTLLWVGIAGAVLVGGYVAVRAGAVQVLAIAVSGVLSEIKRKLMPAPKVASP